MSFTCVIVDDEPPSHEVMKNYLARFPQLKIMGAFFNAKDAGEFLKHHAIDLLFLDIRMPEINGLDFLRSLEHKPFSIITTAYRDYALEGFELGVIDYLLKPLQFDRFESSLKRTLDLLKLVKSNNTIDDKGSKGFEILIRTGQKKILVDYRSITHAQGLKDYTILYTKDKKYIVRGNVKATEKFLPEGDFQRVHKSFIVAINKIKLIQKHKIEFDNVSIPIGRIYRDRVETFLITGKFGPPVDEQQP